MDSDGCVEGWGGAEICTPVIPPDHGDVEDTFGVVRRHVRFDAHPATTYIMIEQIFISKPIHGLGLEVIHYMGGKRTEKTG